MTRFERFVAIGDSTVEGMDDPDGHGGYRGWANRLAERLARLQGSVLYANLGIRGRTVRQVLDEQLAPAVAMLPDLAAVVSGTNDLMRPHFDADAVGADIETMQRALIAAGAAVITFTLPDLTPVMPLARVLRKRVDALAVATRNACGRSGAILCDLAVHPVATDPRLWSDDRLHANSLGHERIERALAFHLGLEGTDDSWSDPLVTPWAPGFRDVAAAELAWVTGHLLPWVWRHARGISSGDGRTAKRPLMAIMKPC